LLAVDRILDVDRRSTCKSYCRWTFDKACPLTYAKYRSVRY
jgi:hypothetical protein